MESILHPWHFLVLVLSALNNHERNCELRIRYCGRNLATASPNRSNSRSADMQLICCTDPLDLCMVCVEVLLRSGFSVLRKVNRRKDLRGKRRGSVEIEMVEAAGIEPATFRSVQRGKFF